MPNKRTSRFDRDEWLDRVFRNRDLTDRQVLACIRIYRLLGRQTNTSHVRILTGS